MESSGKYGGMTTNASGSLCRVDWQTSEPRGRNLEQGQATELVRGRRTELGDFKVQWSKFRDPLRREDQLILDELFHGLEIHKDAYESMPGRDMIAATVVPKAMEQEKVG